MEIDDYENIHQKQDLSIKTDINLLKSKLQLFSKVTHKEEKFIRTPDNTYINESNEFIKDLAPTHNQFYLNQNTRANKMRQKLMINAKNKWPTTTICEKIREVQDKVIYNSLNIY